MYIIYIYMNIYVSMRIYLYIYTYIYKDAFDSFVPLRSCLVNYLKDNRDPNLKHHSLVHPRPSKKHALAGPDPWHRVHKPSVSG
jgi:hypothetical protein